MLPERFPVLGGIKKSFSSVCHRVLYKILFWWHQTPVTSQIKPPSKNHLKDLMDWRNGNEINRFWSLNLSFNNGLSQSESCLVACTLGLTTNPTTAEDDQVRTSEPPSKKGQSQDRRDSSGKKIVAVYESTSKYQVLLTHKQEIKRRETEFTRVIQI